MAFNFAPGVLQQKGIATAGGAPAFGAAPVPGLLGMVGQEGSGYGPAQMSTLGGAQVGSEAADGVQRMYDSAPAAMTGGTYFKDGYALSPTAGGNYAVYQPAAPGMSEQLNGTSYDIYNPQGQYVGQNEFTGLGNKLGDLWDKAIPLATAAFIGGGIAGGFGYGPFAGGGATPGAAGFAGDPTAWGYGGAPDALGAAGASSMGGGASTPFGGLGAAGVGTAAMGAAGAGGAAGVPANPFYGGAGGAASGGGGALSNLLGGSGGTNWLGLGATALGALGGAQGQNGSTSSTRAMDPRMDQLFYGDLAQRVQSLLGSESPQARAIGQQLLAAGGGLLGQTAPTTATNPYLKGIADDMQKRTTDLLAQNNQAIRGNAVGTGTMGGSRQGVAEGVAAGKAADFLQGNLANLYGQAYQGDQARLRQDWTIGSGLLNQGLGAPWVPATSAANVYGPFTGFGTTTNSAQSGGGWQGAVGGALTGASLGRQMGWW